MSEEIWWSAGAITRPVLAVAGWDLTEARRSDIILECMVNRLDLECTGPVEAMSRP